MHVKLVFRVHDVLLHEPQRNTQGNRRTEGEEDDTTRNHGRPPPELVRLRRVQNDVEVLLQLGFLKGIQYEVRNHGNHTRDEKEHVRNREEDDEVKVLEHALTKAGRGSVKREGERSDRRNMGGMGMAGWKEAEDGAGERERERGDNHAPISQGSERRPPGHGRSWTQMLVFCRLLSGNLISIDDTQKWGELEGRT